MAQGVSLPLALPTKETAVDPIEVVYKSDAERGAVWHAIFAADAPELRLVDWSPEAAAACRYLVA